MNRFVALALFVGVCLLAAAAGSLLTRTSVVSWYPSLQKPSYNPPNWVFGPVWTALYILMGTAAWLVWRSAGWQGARLALSLFFAQLALNVAWSAIFFGMRQPGAAFAEILLLWLAILATTIAFAPHSQAASTLMLPYLAWVAFAAVLNHALWRLNA